MIFKAAERSVWWSASLKVCAGATTMLSPVWIPIGSRFSMLHTMIVLSLESLITSYSYSFQPMTLSSMSTCLILEYIRPLPAM